MYAGFTVTIKLRCPVKIQSHAAPRRAFQRTPLQDHTNAEVDVDSESKNRNKIEK